MAVSISDSLHLLEKLVEWKHSYLHLSGGCVKETLHLLEKLVEWKLFLQHCHIMMETLHLLEKLVEWKHCDL